MSSTNLSKVIIIGGGAAGLAAAQQLIKRGIKNYLVLEAQSHLGGRIHTVEHGDHLLEYGAQWVHGEDGNEVYSLAKENAMISEERTLKQTGVGDTIFVMEDASIIDPEIVTLFQMQMANLKESAEKELSTYKESIGKYFTEKFLEVNKWGSTGVELLEWHGRFQCCIDGSDTWFEISGAGSAMYHECPGNQVINWNKGYETLITYLKKEIPDSQILLNAAVERIVWGDPSCVKVELSTGETLCSEHVVVTPSLAVLKDRHEKMFEPSLPPKKVAAVQGLAIDVVDKVFLEFDSRWWGNCDGFSFTRKETGQGFDPENWEKRILGFYEVYRQPNMLCAWITGNPAKAMEKCSNDEIKDRCMRLIKSYLATHYTIPEPIWWDTSRWHSNPFVKGSYSYRSMRSEVVGATAEDLSSPLCSDRGAPVVCFAGEATHSCFFSTVHGAVESGWREANRIADFGRIDSPLSPAGKKFSFDVVIVGAGISGIGAAKELERNGVASVVLLEASDRIGGRVFTVLPPSGGIVDFGAQWIHGHVDNMLYDTVAPRGLIGAHVSVDGQGDFFTDKGEKLEPAFVSDILETCDLLKEEFPQFNGRGGVPPPSIGHYFRARFQELLDAGEEGNTPRERRIKEALYHWNVRWERIDNACDSLHQLSATHYGDYFSIKGFDNMNPDRGMQSLVNSLRSDVRAEVRLNSEVSEIDYAREVAEGRETRSSVEGGTRPVRIKCRNGDIYECNHAMVTCSVGYLKKHKDHLFRPPLPPSKDKAITELGYGVIDKIYLEFETPFWGPDFTGIHLVWTDDEIPDFDRPEPDTRLLDGRRLEPEHFWYRAISGFDPVFGHKSMLCGWIGGPEAEYMECLSLAEVTRVCTGLLRQFTGNARIPDPINVYRSQWATNPLFLGSYSHRTSVADYSGEDYIAVMNSPVYAMTPLGEKVPVVTFAGEANSLNAYSTLHGALENGSSQTSHYLSFRNSLKDKKEEELKSKL